MVGRQELDGNFRDIKKVIRQVVEWGLYQEGMSDSKTHSILAKSEGSYFTSYLNLS